MDSVLRQRGVRAEEGEGVEHREVGQDSLLQKNIAQTGSTGRPRWDAAGSSWSLGEPGTNWVCGVRGSVLTKAVLEGG